jgi:F-type H+-transporting ATPase subunit epsilon
MADTMQFDLVSPERRLASVQASEVQIPGAEGDMTAMPGHAPTITTLRPGVLRVISDAGSQEYIVTGGFAEVTAEGISVLAERAVPSGELTQPMLDEFVSEAVALRDAATAQHLDISAKNVSDIGMMASQLGLSVKEL